MQSSSSAKPAQRPADRSQSEPDRRHDFVTAPTPQDKILRLNRDIRLHGVHRLAAQADVGERRNDENQYAKDDEAAPPILAVDPRIGFSIIHGER
jgi:hypothetical protein